MNKNKRNALKILTLGGAATLADKWVKPVISSVMLPAHAQMSGAIDPEINIYRECTNVTLNFYYELTFSPDPATPTSTINLSSELSGVGPAPSGDSVLFQFTLDSNELTASVSTSSGVINLQKSNASCDGSGGFSAVRNDLLPSGATLKYSFSVRSAINGDVNFMFPRFKFSEFSII